MLEPPPQSDSKKAEKDTATSAALKCAYQIMQQRIISQPKDMMGVLLFGTEESKFQDEDIDSRGGLAYPHCYLLADLDVPTARDVKALKTLVEDEDEAKSLLVPTSEPVTMSNLLFCVNQIFTTKAPNFGSRRLFIITDRDDPHADDKGMRSAAAVRAKDLYDLGVIIELFPISKPDHEFDRTKFYDVCSSTNCLIASSNQTRILSTVIRQIPIAQPQHRRQSKQLEVVAFHFLVLLSQTLTLSKLPNAHCSQTYLSRLVLDLKYL